MLHLYFFFFIFFYAPFVAGFFAFALRSVRSIRQFLQWFLWMKKYTHHNNSFTTFCSGWAPVRRNAEKNPFYLVSRNRITKDNKIQCCITATSRLLLLLLLLFFSLFFLFRIILNGIKNPDNDETNKKTAVSFIDEPNTTKNRKRINVK